MRRWTSGTVCKFEKKHIRYNVFSIWDNSRSLKKLKGLQKSIFLTLKDLKNDRKQSNNSDPKMYTDLNLNIMGNMCETHICSKNNLIFKNLKQFLTYAFSACLNWDQIPGIPRRQKWYLRQTSVRKVRFCLTRKYS